MSQSVGIDLTYGHGRRSHNSVRHSIGHNSARNSHISDALLFTWFEDILDCEDERASEEQEGEAASADAPADGRLRKQRDSKTWEALEGAAAEGADRPPPLLEHNDHPASESTPRSNITMKDSPWTDDDDPANPQNWRSSRKWANMVVVGWICFVTPLASSMLAPGLPQLAKDLRIVQAPLAAFSLSIFLLGSGTSALLAAPLSELYGRLPVYHASNAGFTIFTVACGFSPNTVALLMFRFLAGCFGSACLAIAMGTCADMFPPQLRARSGSCLVIALMLGPCLGPVTGGMLVHAWTWRSVFYALTCLGGFNILLSIFVLRETYAPAILRHRARLLRCKDCNQVLKSKDPEKRAIERERGTVRTALKRPLKMMAVSPVVTLVCLFSAIVYSILYLVITTIPFVFAPRYSFASWQTGLLYLAPGSGMVVGLVASGQLSDRIVKKQRAAGQRHVPEDRLPLWITLPAIVAVTSGLILYGWTIQAGLHWAVPLIGLAVFGIGLTAATSSSQMYLVECHITYVASVSAANSLLRSLMTGLLPLGGLDLYKTIGIGWGSTLLAAGAAVAAMILFICRINGNALRSRFPVKL